MRKIHLRVSPGLPVFKGVINNYREGGGYTMGGGGQVKFYPNNKKLGGTEKVLALLRGGGEGEGGYNKF